MYICILIYFDSQIDENVAREIINHRSLRHPNIIRFKEVCASVLLSEIAMFQRQSKEKSEHCSVLTWVLELQVVLTPTHLAIVMEYAAGGELFERICSAGRFSEDEV